MSFWNCCCTGTPCGSVCVTVNGCPITGVSMAGSTVTVIDSGGSTVSTCTADATGKCCASIFAAGTYSIKVDGPPGTNYASKTVSRSLTCVSQDLTVALSPAAGYICSSQCEPAGCLTGTPPYPDPGIAETLFFNDGFGVITLTAINGAGAVQFKKWRGCAMRTATTAFLCGSTSSGTNQSVSVVVEVVCTGTGGSAVDYQFSLNNWACVATTSCRPTLAANGTGNPAASTCAGDAGCTGRAGDNGLAIITTLDGLSSACLPAISFSHAVSFSAPPADSTGFKIYGAGPRTMTCTS